MELILNPNKQDIYFISDPHFGHKNICRGVSKWDDKSVCRDFDTLEEMNKHILTVMNHPKEDDIIVCLGDWSFGGKENIYKFRYQIRCKNIILIYGNHDDNIKNDEMYQALFTQCGYYAKIRIENETFICFHYPIASWEGMNKGWIQVHGHVHLSPKNKISRGRAIDVGLDGLNSDVPYHWTSIVKITEKNPIDTLVLPEDHHKKEVR